MSVPLGVQVRPDALKFGCHFLLYEGSPSEAGCLEPANFMRETSTPRRTPVDPASPTVARRPTHRTTGGSWLVVDVCVVFFSGEVLRSMLAMFHSDSPTWKWNIHLFVDEK